MTIKSIHSIQKKEADFTSIHSVNETNDISINDDENVIQKYYAPF